MPQDAVVGLCLERWTRLAQFHIQEGIGLSGYDPLSPIGMKVQAEKELRLAHRCTKRDYDARLAR